MNTEGRILAVDDELKWRENFARWIPKDVATQDSVSTAREAAEKIRIYHYDLVLLDLSMDVGDTLNRDTRPIQEYLATKPEGTVYFVVSSTAEREEGRDAAYKLGAAWVFFKTDSTLRQELAAKAAAAIEDAAYHRGQAIIAAQKKLDPDQFGEHQIFGALQIGAEELYSILGALSRAMAPIASHVDRPHCTVSGGCVVALFWSRRHGTAVSVVLAPPAVGDETALMSLADWLGFSTRGKMLLDTQLHHVRVRAFEEPSIGDTYFGLPVIQIAP
jgi:CheY-like chemotaxis protein